MDTVQKMLYQKRGSALVKNLQSRHFDAVYCEDREQALQAALSWIPEGASVGWGGAMSAQQIGLMEAVKQGPYIAMDRDSCQSPQEREQLMHQHLTADVFITGANAISLDGQMVNIDGTGNRLAAINFGPKSVLVIVGMNKVTDTLQEAVRRARTVAAPLNQQRFLLDNPCSITGTCADCKSVSCICNQILITRHCRPQGRIRFVVVGEALGL